MRRFIKDDGLSVAEKSNRPKLNCLRKDLIAIFHNEELNIIFDTNLTTT